METVSRSSRGPGAACPPPFGRDRAAAGIDGARAHDLEDMACLVRAYDRGAQMFSEDDPGRAWLYKGLAGQNFAGLVNALRAEGLLPSEAGRVADKMTRRR